MGIATVIVVGDEVANMVRGMLKLVPVEDKATEFWVAEFLGDGTSQNPGA